MKKLTVYILAAFLSVIFIPAQLKASPADSSISITASDAKESDALIARLGEIKSIDESDMSYSEMRVLHKESRTIKARLADISGGVYISVGAIILIVILLIILL